ETMAPRLARLRYVQKVHPSGLNMMASPETVFAFDEAKMTFINGQFIATLLLVNAFMEHWLGSLISSKGYTKSAQRGLKSIIDCAREQDLVNHFLLDRVDELRRIRNPFVHLRSFDDDSRLTRRALSAQVDPCCMIEDDAKKAMSIMYTVAIR
ncbi:MAG: hypothetical protein KAW91_00265, partial [candidate division Zixibacteria bacterium]|nr:hypothetical protein [candidate division Zixibacteria bacterium]